MDIAPLILNPLLFNFYKSFTLPFPHTSNNTKPHKNSCDPFTEKPILKMYGTYDEFTLSTASFKMIAIFHVII